MIKAAIPHNEVERVEALRKYNILDTLPTQNFDDLTKLAAIICGTPVAQVTLVEGQRTWFKSSLGFPGSQAERETSFCAHTINQVDGLMIVADATKDIRFFDNPAVSEMGLRFYAGAALCTPDGFRLGALCVVDMKPKELTESQIEALEALARQVEWQLELHRKVIEMHLLSQELYQAERRAWAAYKVKAEFLANMSHEIRTPLNGIIGMSDLLLESKLDSEQSRRVQVLQSSGSSLLALINDILDFSKLEAGKVELENIPVDLKRLIEDVSELFRPMCESKDLKLELDVQDDMPLVMGDLHRLRQILNNLIGNAIKFTDKGKIAVFCRARMDGGRSEIELAIRDTGEGIPEDARDKIFLSFSQVDAATSRKHGGTGLGLSISHELATLMGGKMWFESEVGQGTTFFLRWKAQIAQATPRPVVAQSQWSFTNPQEVAILVAEDNSTNRMVILGYLERFGVQADTATNGAEALEKMKHRRYDMILMDCQMPVMDGFEATEKIVAAEPSPLKRPRIVAMTANTRPEDRARCFKVGMDDYLSKPFKMVDLRRILASHLARFGSEKSA